jgi:small-conductance mechanosensitive channel
MPDDLIDTALISSQNAAVNSVGELLAQASPLYWLITFLIVVGCYGATWLIQRWLRTRDVSRNTPNWLEVHSLAEILWPLFLWVASRLTLVIFNRLDMPSIWFDFLSKLFGAYLIVRVFLYIVRRAMPVGSLRLLIERTSVVVIWLGMLLNYVGKLDRWLDVLDGFKVTLGKNTITLSDVLALVLVILIVYLIVSWLAHEVDSILLKRPNRYFSQIDLSTRVVLARIFKGLLVVFGVLFSLTAVGMDLTILSVFGGALGVGIGLGLQKLASNYVSGFVMLFERSIRIGDLVTTSDGYRGNVKQINARYTIIEGVSGNEILVPNEALVTQNVVNWSLHDKRIWMNVTIQVKHETNIEELIPQVLDEMQKIPRLLHEPTPGVNLVRITEKGNVLELSWWIDDPENGRANVTSDVNIAILKVCRALNVEFFTVQLPDNTEPLKE